MKIKTHSVGLKVGRVAPRPPHSIDNEIGHCIANAEQPSVARQAKAAKGHAALAE